MSRLLVAQRALTVPGWAKDALWRSAQAIPSLDLRFADNKSLVDAVTGASLITFTRASSGTFVDSAGVLQTATTNLLLQSEDFGTTWFLTSATLSANAIAAPNGTLTAEQLVEAATTANHEAGQTFASPVANATYTLSCYLKAATSTTCGIRFSNGLNGTGIICSVDLTAQTVTVTAGTGTATIANVGSGWFRVSLTATASGTPASTTVSIFRSIGTAGSIANSIYLWGAQLEQSATVGEYIPTTSAINSAPRFDHNPTTGESLGLLVEEQRTNSIRNNTMVGAVAGTPGTLPTNWSTALIGLTREILGTGTENGITYLDVKLSGTTNAQTFSISLESLVPASASQSWTVSSYVKVVAGSTAGISAAGTFLSSYNSATGFLSVLLSPSPFTASLTRAVTTGTTPANTAFVQPGFYFTCSAVSGVVIDITLRIGLPQLEQGAFATSPILTSTAAATRSADVASITGTAFSGWYRQDEGTVYGEGSTFNTGASSCLVSIDDTTSSNRIQLRRSTSASTLRMVSSGGSIDANLTTGTALGTNKIATGISANNQNLVSNGVIATGITSITPMPTVTQAQIGNGPASNIFNGTIRRLTYWPQALPSRLQALTQ